MLFFLSALRRGVRLPGLHRRVHVLPSQNPPNRNNLRGTGKLVPTDHVPLQRPVLLHRHVVRVPPEGAEEGGAHGRLPGKLRFRLHPSQVRVQRPQYDGGWVRAHPWPSKLDFEACFSEWFWSCKVLKSGMLLVCIRV